MKRYVIEETVEYEVEGANPQDAIERFLSAPDVCAFSVGVSERVMGEILPDGDVEFDIEYVESEGGNR